MTDTVGQIELAQDERFVPQIAWISGWTCIHCGREPKGHGWSERQGEQINFVCPDGKRYEP